MARTKLNSEKRSRKLFFSHCRQFIWYLAKETKNTTKHIIMKKVFIYARVCVNKDFVLSGSIGLTQGKHARYVIIISFSYIRALLVVLPWVVTTIPRFEDLSALST